jgi:hypothetical protein
VPTHAIRFGISDGNFRASTWKLWTPARKFDVYLACRELGGELKASLHESGQWHVAYSKTFFDEKLVGSEPQTQQSRFIQDWWRPKPISADITLAYRILTPHSAVTIPITAADKKLSWIPNCHPSRATQIAVFIISSATSDVSGWPGEDHGAKPVENYNLPNGESVWVVYKDIKMPDLSATRAGPLQFFNGKDKEDLKPGNLRAVIFGDAPDGSRLIYDCLVQRNSDIANKK